MLPEHTITRRVQFSETDMAGIVHFANYFRWMEEVEHDFFRSLNLSVVMKHDGTDYAWPRVSTGCDYFGPARFEDDVILKLRVTKVGEKSLNYEVDFFVADKQIALGRMTSVCCLFGPAGLKSTPIPPDLRARLTGPLPSQPA
jgi:YbgC/YbaW family acyl-CoA thioester hydrolase